MAADGGSASDPSPPGGSSSSGDTGTLEKALIKGAGVLTQLFPLWCILAAVTGFYHPPTYTWFDTQCISNGLIFIMVCGGHGDNSDSGAHFTRAWGHT